ncbi:MAG TPA: hypothetical protein VMP86_03860 [Candidatus Binatia bacterium]|nr:hypothetical protein [Candidatus Binatia bacterium]
MDGTQPCVGCGKPTAAGRRRFADRRTIDHADGSRSYVCDGCELSISASGRKGELSDDELRQLLENGWMAGIAWSRTGPGGMGGP